MTSLSVLAGGSTSPTAAVADAVCPSESMLTLLSDAGGILWMLRTLLFKSSPPTAPVLDGTDPTDTTDLRLVEHSCEQAEITYSRTASPE
jgi:hypothetical protein